MSPAVELRDCGGSTSHSGRSRLCFYCLWLLTLIQCYAGCYVLSVEKLQGGHGDNGGLHITRTPNYPGQVPYLELLFAPAHAVDRQIRRDYWKDEIVPMGLMPPSDECEFQYPKPAE